MESQGERGPWGAQGEYEGGDAPRRRQAGPSGVSNEAHFILNNYGTRQKNNCPPAAPNKKSYRFVLANR
jgi:hypothetical protein